MASPIDMSNTVLLSLLSTAAGACVQLAMENKEVSSANSLTLGINLCGKSLI